MPGGIQVSSQHNYYTDCKKGEYKLRNPQKYMPDIDPPVFKSSWEEKFFILCDVNPFVTLWGYEPFGISYYSPLYMRQSIYKPDIYLECKYQDGFVDRYLIEIKPDSYATIAKPPTPPKGGLTDPKKMARFQKKMAAFDRKNMDVLVNQAKWEAAMLWCKAQGVNWLVATEANMGDLFKQSTII